MQRSQCTNHRDPLVDNGSLESQTQEDDLVEILTLEKDNLTRLGIDCL